MRKLVINGTFGGYGLSQQAVEMLHKQGIEYPGDLERDDPRLVEVVERLGERADGKYATLEIIEIPEDVEWQIEEYDGAEWVAEKHRTWGR